MISRADCERAFRQAVAACDPAKLVANALPAHGHRLGERDVFAIAVGKAALAIQSIIMGEVMAPPGDNDNMAKSEDKAVAANAAFVAANKGRAEAVFGSFATLGL